VDDAIAKYRELEAAASEGVARDLFLSQRSALEGDGETSLGAIHRIAASSFRDPEGIYFLARAASFIGEPRLALEILRRVVSSGFYIDRTLAKDPWLDPVRDLPEFLDVHREAEAGRRRATAAFFEAEGDKLLGVTSP
jgi:hypothetical protein